MENIVFRLQMLFFHSAISQKRDSFPLATGPNICMYKSGLKLFLFNLK
jgi:hypothetical protein